MANNVTLNTGSGGQTISTEDNGSGVQLARTKLMTGAAGTDGGNVATSNPLPVQIMTAASTAETAGSGISQPSGGAGLLGFISGLYKVLNSFLLGATKEQIVSSGGTTTTAVAAAAAASAIKASAGRLCRVTVTTLGTAALSFYDNATTNTGTILFTVPASAAVGSIYDIQLPAANGIWCASGTNSPAVTIGWL